MNIVSLTCLKSRNRYLQNTISSLKNQSVKPDKIILYYQGVKSDLQKEVLELQDDLFNIEYIDSSLRSYSKYIYSYKKYPEDNIIICDDDITYNDHFVENLVNGHKKHPNDIVCNVYYHVRYDGISMCSTYIDTKEIRNRNIKSLSGWGTFIPAHFYDGTCFLDDCELRKNIDKMPTHDELWLYQNMLLTKNYMYCIGTYKMPFDKTIATDTITFYDCLTHINKKNNNYYNYGKFCVDFLREHNFDFDKYENT